MFKVVSILNVFLFSLVASAQNRCMLTNELKGDVKSGRVSSSPTNISRIDFERLTAKVQKAFAQDFRKRGYTLKIVGEWNNEDENAYANVEDKTAYVHLLGGYAKVMPEDSLMLVACHELGHHLAGAPFYSGDFDGIRMSTEGQSDYFATTKCMRRLLKDSDNRQYIQRYGSHFSVAIDCNRVWGANTNDSFICQRSIMAAMNLRLRFFSNRRDYLTKKDYSHVGATLERHPEPQCRFDTHRAGALCPIGENETADASRHPNCVLGRVRQSSAARPTCWFYN